MGYLLVPELQYWVNDQLHRENGLAVRVWGKYGEIWDEEYYINGKLLTNREFYNRNNSCNESVSVSVSGKVVEIDGKKYKLSEV